MSDDLKEWLDEQFIMIRKIIKGYSKKGCIGISLFYFIVYYFCQSLLLRMYRIKDVLTNPYAEPVLSGGNIYNIWNGISVPKPEV